jgi:isoquinoline 1-oxidoreductase beta subunit
MPIRKISRRHLLIGAGGVAVTVGAGGLWFGIWKAGQRRWAQAVDRDGRFAPNVFLAVGEDDAVTIWVTRTEMGQGVMTGLAMVVAEELDADWGRVKVELATLDSDYDYGSMFTAASSSTSSLWNELRLAGAAARGMLLEAAAARFGVGVSKCRAEASKVICDEKGESLTYGQLAQAASGLRAPLRPQLKAPQEFKLIGKEIPRVDIPGKVDGSAVYGIDVRLPEAVWAALKRAPVRGATLAEVSEEAALQVKGVLQVLRLPTAVAVVGDSSWSVQKGLESLKPTWKFDTVDGAKRGDFSLRLHAELSLPGIIVGESVTSPNLRESFAQRAQYEVPFLAHATMEPMNASVRMSKDICEVWASTQNPESVRSLASEVSGLPLEQCVVHRTLVGGGFGRRTNPDEVEEALRVAKEVGRPVHLFWTREDDMQHGFYREATLHELAGEVSRDGKSLSLFHKVISASSEAEPGAEGIAEEIPLMGATDLPYSIEESRLEWRGVSSPVRVGIWRSVGYSHNTFALESFVDELAHSRKLDPVDLRSALLPPGSRLLACLQEVKKMSGWPRVAEGSSLGVAICSCFGSHVAQIAEITEKDGSPRVVRVWCVVDCGLVINPGSVRAQAEGAIIFGLTAALHGRIHVKDGAVVASNFHDYPLLRQSESPEIFVNILPSAEQPSGVGELAVPPIAPAVANAWFRLKGARLRSLPLI